MDSSLDNLAWRMRVAGQGDSRDSHGNAHGYAPGIGHPRAKFNCDALNSNATTLNDAIPNPFALQDAPADFDSFLDTLAHLAPRSGLSENSRDSVKFFL